MPNNVDLFVDDVYDELDRLYKKDKNGKKHLLGDKPILKIFDNYSDWLANNTNISPKIAANAIYKDIISDRVNYIDFRNRELKRGIQLKGQQSFNLVYGNQKEIDTANKIMYNLKLEDINRYNLMVNVLTKLKEMTDYIKPVKNIFGKTTNLAKSNVKPLKQPTYSSFIAATKLSDKELNIYLKKIENAISIHKQEGNGTI